MSLPSIPNEFVISNCKEIKGYLADCFIFREYSTSEHSFNILKKIQITRDRLFTCSTTVPQLTGKNNLSQLHISSNLTCLIPVEKLYCSAGHDACCCCHCGWKRKFINIYCYPIYSLYKCENKKQIAKPKTLKLKKKK